MSLRLGIDVGGTNTDAVLIDGDNVIGCAKQFTSKDVLSGINSAVRSVIAGSRADHADVKVCMLGTTQLVNACVQHRGLARVAVLRLCGPATHALPPFCDVPADLLDVLGGHFQLLDGGFEFDGGTEISPINTEQIQQATDTALKAGYTSLVVSGIFSPVNSSQEEAAADIMRKHVALHHTGRVRVNRSHEFTELGLLERENAAILNASLRPLADQLLPSFQKAFHDAGLTGALYLTGNDGTLMTAEKAQRLPLHTFQSGPVNSLRGAAKLSGLSDGIVVDIGGTTTDVGVLQAGFPRPASTEAVLAGVRINQRVPDVFSIGLGGGSVVRWEKGVCTVGPDSVGSQLINRALVFGGSVCTATDVAVRLGKLKLGSQHLTSGLAEEEAQQAWDTMQAMLAQCIDQVKTSAEDVPVIVVGGGAGLCENALAGASEVIKPPHADVANAVGAALPQVSGAVDGVFEMGSEGQKRSACLAEAQASAHAKAVQAGADPSTCQVVAIDEVPLAYLPGGIVRLHVQVVGDLQIAQHDRQQLSQPQESDYKSSEQQQQQQQQEIGHKSQQQQQQQQTQQQPQQQQQQESGHELQQQQQWQQHEASAHKSQPPAQQQQQVPEQQQPQAPATPQQQSHTSYREALAASAALPNKSGSQAPSTKQSGKSSIAGMSKTAKTACAQQPSKSAAATKDQLSAASLQGVGMASTTAAATATTAAATATAAASASASGTKRTNAGNAASCRDETTSVPSEGSSDAVNGGWVITREHIEALAIGCGILGTGGGGSPYRAKLKLLQRLKEGSNIRVIPCSAVPDDAYVVDASYMGAPTVSIEKLDSSQAEAAARAVLKAVGKEAFAIVAGEIGGGNGLEALNVAAAMQLPVVDADFMGRAFPELQMMTTAIYGVPVAPAALADEKGNAVVVQSVANIHSLEHILRPVCTAMGCSAGFASAPITGKQLQEVAIQGSVSLALRIGQAVQRAQREKTDPVAAAAMAGNGKVMFEGKVTDIERNTTQGFAKGRMTIAGLDEWHDQCGDIQFQNENLILKVNGNLKTSVPDLICCLDTQSGKAIATEELRYALRMSVVEIPADGKLLTPEALEVVGQKAFRLQDL